jgi:hypothetical protein
MGRAEAEFWGVRHTAVPDSELAARPFSRAAGLRLVTPDVLEGPGFQRMCRGAYWIRGADVTYVRRIQAYRCVLPARAVLGGWSAACALDVPWVPQDAPVEIVLPRWERVRRRPGLRVRGDVLTAGEVVGTPLGPATSGRGRPSTSPGEARYPVPSPHWMPSCASPDAHRPRSRRWRAGIPGVRGIRLLREALRLADPRAESPPESLLRVLILVSGLPRPVPQYEVWDGARFVARLDLAWPAVRAAVEYDGAHHREPDQFRRDLLRHNRLRELGWVVLQVDSAQLAHADGLLAQLHRLLSARV